MRPMTSSRSMALGPCLALLLGLLPAGLVARSRPGLPSTRVTSGNGVQLVFGLEPYVDRLMEDLDRARRSIWVDVYILGGDVGLKVARKLVERQEAGLDVRVILDRHLGVIGRLRSQVKQVKEYLDGTGVPLRLSVNREAGRILHSWSEDHNKVVLIDGRILYVGGTNVTDHFLRYNDLMVRVEGPISGFVRSQYLHDWYYAGDPEAASDLGPDREFRDRGLLQPVLGRRGATIRLVGTGLGRLTFDGALRNAIRSSRSSIDLQVHHLDYDEAIDELLAAADRGVAVRALLDPTNIDNYIPLLRRGPRGVLNSYAVSRLRSSGVEVRFVELGEDYDAYHMKLALFDGEVLLTGTANWTRLSARTATETVLEITGTAAVREAATWFDAQWAQNSETPEYGYAARVINYLYRLFN